MPSTALTKQKRKPDRRPNIVVVMTDDQRADEVPFMPQLQRLVAGGGVTFDNSFVSYSFCCPSRATLFTGQYAHNHGVLSNVPPAGGYSKLAPSLGNSLPVWLRRAGYYTGHVGKFLNGYETERVPPGWNEWYGSIEAGAYGYNLNENGKIVHYGSTFDAVDPGTYQTDVLAAKATGFIRRSTPKRKPFFLTVAPFAPHFEHSSCGCASNPRAAPRHEGAFANAPLPKPPSYNEADVSDKPEAVKKLSPIPPAGDAVVTRYYHDRLESLLAVDDMIGGLVRTLKRKGELRNTVIIFTSDNGFMLGEHRIREGKLWPYEPSIRVPLIIRGPRVPKGATRSQPVVNADLAPTILDFANAKARRKPDGLSMLPLLKHPQLNWGRGILLEAFFNADGTEAPGFQSTVYRGVRTDRYVYLTYSTGEEELYDLRRDPSQLESRHKDSEYGAVHASLVRLLGTLQNCVGGTCRSRPGLRLDLEFRSGRRCVASGIQANLVGPSLGEAGSPRFFVGGREASDGDGAPFEVTIRRKALSRSHKTGIAAVVSTLDGRTVSLKQVAPAAC